MKQINVLEEFHSSSGLIIITHLLGTYSLNEYLIDEKQNVYQIHGMHLTKAFMDENKIMLFVEKVDPEEAAKNELEMASKAGRDSITDKHSWVSE